MPKTTLSWIFLFGLALASLALSYNQLSQLPQFPVAVGPNMTVRAILPGPSVEKKTSPFERDDRLVAVQGRGVDELRDMRSVLQNLDFSKVATQDPELLKAQNLAQPGLEVSYQIVRPLHRFNVLLQGDALDPTGLPPGVEPTDMLVELDGRPMQPAIGPEGLRSIISSRPEAFLVFERKNAVFTGRLNLMPPQPPIEVMATFAIALLLLMALWRFRHSSLAGWTALAVGLETVAFAWLAVVVFQYQWVLADYTLAYLTIISLVLMRPVGIFARTATAEGVGARTWGVVALGAIGAALVCVLLGRGTIDNAELALQLAAMLSGFFVIFEIVLTGLNEESGKLLGERSIYLAGIILFVLLASLLSWSMDDSAFREDRWRWFATAVLALVWFGDILLCFRGLPGTQFDEIMDEPRRHEAIWSYLADLNACYDGVDFALVFYRDEHAVIVRMERDALSLERIHGALLDAISILLQENARVPSSVFEDPSADPMVGIAQAMKIALALRLAPPRQALDVGELSVVLLGFYEGESVPSLADADLDFVQQRLSAVHWAAGLVEGLRRLASSAGPAAAALAAPPTAQELEELEHKIGLMSEHQREIEEQLALTRELYRPAPELIPHALDQLLEPELIEAVEFLLSEPGPIVLAGAVGTGKRFVARAAHALDGPRQGSPCLRLELLAYEPTREELNRLGQDLFGREGDGLGLLAMCLGGSLIIEHAHLMPLSIWGELLEEAAAAQVRLYLCFDAEDAEARSVLEGMPQAVIEALEPRELVLPAFGSRESIKLSVLSSLLELSSVVYMRQLDGFSEAAASALMAYQFPGQLVEARAMMDLVARHALGPVVEIGDLPREVRRA